MDHLIPELRSRLMARVRRKDTRPELLVRRVVHAMGYRYRLHVASLPGTPDIVFPRLRKIILVHGCFWHRHACRRGRSNPSTRARFWAEKLKRNRDRDAQVKRRLRLGGWDVLVVWECRLIHPEALRRRLAAFLRRTNPRTMSGKVSTRGQI